MATATVKQPLFVYSVVLSTALTFLVVTLGSFSLIEASRATVFDSADRLARRFAEAGDMARIQMVVDAHGNDGGTGATLVTASSAGLGIDLLRARAAVLDPGAARREGFLAAPIPGQGQEAYVVYRPEFSVALAIARGEMPHGR